MQLPLAGFATVGVVYYVLLGCVLYRAADRRDRVATRLALVVLVLNEVWNVGFFGQRSVRTGFFGILAFLVPLVALQIAVSKDRRSSLLLAPYTAWVICYDVPWTLRLWRLNSDPSCRRRHTIGHDHGHRAAGRVRAIIGQVRNAVLRSAVPAPVAGTSRCAASGAAR